MELRVSDAPAEDAAAWLARRLRGAVQRRGRASLAVSGGSTAPPMFDALLECGVPWEAVEIWQVDERVVPDGHRARNSTQLVVLPATAHPMPVTAPDLDAAADDYAAGLPERFDVVHLGLGEDGHTASWPPGDPVVDSRAQCAVVGTFNGFERMTLTPQVVNGARSRLLLVAGGGKAPMVRRWLLRDPQLPVDRVRRSDTWAFIDPAAAAQLPASATG